MTDRRKRISRTTVYERLRKRSWRDLKEWSKSKEEHKAYLEGVRDTLNENRRGLELAGLL